MSIRTSFKSIGASSNENIEKGWKKAELSCTPSSYFLYSPVGYNLETDTYAIQKADQSVVLTKDFNTIIKSFTGSLIVSTEKKSLFSDSNAYIYTLDSNDNFIQINSPRYYILFPSKIALNESNGSIVIGENGIMGGFSVVGSSDFNTFSQIDMNNYSDGMIMYAFYNPVDKYIYFSGRRGNENADYPKRTANGISVENSSVPAIFNGFKTNAKVTYIKNKFYAFGYYNPTNYLRSADDIFGTYSDISLPNLEGCYIDFLEKNKKETFSILCARAFNYSSNLYTNSVLYYTKDFLEWKRLLLPLDVDDIIIWIKYFKDRFVVYTQKGQIFYKKI